MKRELALFVAIVVIAAPVAVAFWVAAQDRQPPPPATVSFELLGVPPHEENDLFMRITTPAGSHVLRVSSITGFSYYDKEELLRNNIYFAGGKVETTATEEDIRAAIAESEGLIRAIKNPTVEMIKNGGGP